MKKFFYFFIIFFLGFFAFVSCTSDKKESQTSHDDFVSSLSSADTTEVLNLCQDFFSKLANNAKEEALAMLSLSNDSGEVLPMTEEKLQSLSRQFTLFPVLDQHLVDFKFGNASDNLTRFKVVFAKDEDGKEECINFGLNPIRKDGKWFLTVRNASAQVAQ